MTLDATSLLQPSFFEAEIRPRYGKFYDAATPLLNALNEFTLKAGKRSTPQQAVIRNLCMMTGFAVHDVAILVASGSGLGALKITRSALEYAINAEYLRLFSDETIRYLNWNYIERHKQLNYMRARIPLEFAKLDAAIVAESERMYREVRPLFLNKKGRLLSSWCTHSLLERAKATNSEDVYHLIYVSGSGLSHGSFSGLAQHAEGFTDEGWQPAIPPSLTGCGPALQNVHFCGLRAVKTLCLMNNKDSTPPLLDLEKEFQSSWAEYNASDSDAF
jgi:hypothetical protein